MIDESFVAFVYTNGHTLFVCDESNRARVFASREFAQKVGEAISIMVKVVTLDEAAKLNPQMKFGDLEKYE